MRLFRHLSNGTTKVDVDNAHPETLTQLGANHRQSRRVVVPYLHRQWPRLECNSPKQIWVLLLHFLHPVEALGIDHFGRLQTDTTIFADDLSKREVRESRHGSLQNGRVDFERADVKRVHLAHGRCGGGLNGNIHDLIFNGEPAGAKWHLVA